MKVVVEGTKTDGKKFRKEIKIDLEKLNFKDKKLASVDLSPLSSCQNLQMLDLSTNRLSFIDLSPLKSCTKLRGLRLYKNLLVSVDLSPLKSCPNLQELYLAANRLSSVDLSPLSSCKKLQWLWLEENQLASLDLSPLKSCTELRGLWLNKNQLTSLDPSPLNSCQNLQWLNLSENQLASVDLSPLQSCQELQNLQFFSNVSIAWRSTQLDLEGLPNGLKIYAERIQQAWEEYTKPEREKAAAALVSEGLQALANGKLKEARKQFEKALIIAPTNQEALMGREIVDKRLLNAQTVLEILSKFKKHTSVEIKWIAGMAYLSEEEIESAIKDILREQPTFGDYLELGRGEYGFIRKTDSAGTSPTTASGTEEKTYTCYFCSFSLEKNSKTCPACGKAVLRCAVCKLPISFGEPVGECSRCGSKGHLAHMQEWIKIEGTCPHCLQEIPLEAIIPVANYESQ